MIIRRWLMLCPVVLLGLFAGGAGRLGVAEAAPEQVTGLSARHVAGQTFLTWRESVAPDLPGTVSVDRLTALRSELGKAPRIRYRIYRSTAPLTDLAGLVPVAEVGPLTAWNIDFYGGQAKPDDPALRYVIADGEDPLAPGTGLAVVNPPTAGPAWYAVTAVSNGREQQRLDPANTLMTPVEETVAPGRPVLQRIERPREFNYVRDPTLHYFVRWEAPPNCSVAGRPFDYLVACPPNQATPAPVGLHLHCWGGSLTGGYGWWYNAERGAVLIASNQIPYDWWTGYHERYFDGGKLDTPEAVAAGVVRPYTQTRLLSFLDWAATRWELDLTQVFAAGNSMGGSGAPMLALRRPDRIAWAVSWVGVHLPARSPTFRSSYEQVWGRPELGARFEDGSSVWDYFDNARFLRANPRLEIGFITFANGKNDGGIGWAQAVEFLRALQETRRPHLFVWGQAGHLQRAVMPRLGGERVNPLELRTDHSLPAFTGCSLDDDPGDGDPATGAPSGQVNRYLDWDPASVVDEIDRWEVTVGLIAQSPRADCLVDITPRRRQRCRPAPGTRLTWSNTSLADGRVLQTGSASVDDDGLVTLPRVLVDRGQNRLRLSVER